MSQGRRSVSVLFLFMFVAAPLVGQSTPTGGQDSCPGKAGSNFCEDYLRFAAQERTRQRIAAAARTEGMDDPSGWIWVRRDSTGTLTVNKIGVELPEKVRRRLDGYLTPRVMRHCTEPGAEVYVNLNLDPPVPYPHPDSTSRRARLINEQQVYRHMRRRPRSIELSSAVGRDGEVVVLHLLIDATGKVREISVESSTEEGNEEIVDAYAAWVASKMKFRPCKHYGAPVACWVGQPIRLQWQ